MNAQLLSPLNQQLAAELRQNAALAAARIDSNHESVPAFLHDYPYVLGAWPVFVTQQVIREHFRPLTASMPRILYRSLRARFSDSKAMTEYFGWPELTYHILEQAPVDPRDVLLRHDAVLDAGGVKLLENNCGSSATGWEADYFEPQMRTLLGRLGQPLASSSGYRPILHSLLKALADGICRRRSAGASGNLLVHYTLSPGGRNPANLRDSLQSVYNAVKPRALADGRIVIFREFDEIGFTAAGEVTAHGEIIDAIILGDALYMDMPQTVLNRLVTAYLREQLVFPDSPFHALLSDKGLLALMHECRTARLLDADDCAFIERYVPWSARLRDEEVLFEGVHVPLMRHVMAYKDDFVIKKCDSSSGRDVVIGRNVDAATWERIIRASVETRTRWIVQQFCTPGLLDVHHPALGVVPHALIWGIFSYGAEYAGAFIRADRGSAQHGVINSASGATELSVFEVD